MMDARLPPRVLGASVKHDDIKSREETAEVGQGTVGE